jgi:hypothetical protein
MKEMPQSTTNVLCWPKRLLSADDLRRHLTSQRELLLLPRTVITPLAADELRAKGVRILWEAPASTEAKTPKHGKWLYAQEKSDALIASAIQAVERDGIQMTARDGASARAFAEAILAADHAGGILFCGDAATACCIANKIAGIRAGAMRNNDQALRAQKNLGANLFAIEFPGPTFFELRQILRTIATRAPKCPDAVAILLKELDGHAHR